MGIDIEGTLDAWGETFIALKMLQHELQEASGDMTVEDDWSWQEPHRELVRDVWKVIATTPAEKRLEVARGYTEMARHAILAVRMTAEKGGQNEPEAPER